MKKYRVFVSYNGGYVTTVYAESEAEAYDIAIDEADESLVDGFDIDAEVEEI